MLRRQAVGVLGVIVMAAGMFPASSSAAPTPTPDTGTTTRTEADRLKGLAAAQRRQLEAARQEINRLAVVVAKAQTEEAAARKEQQDALAAALEQTNGLNRASAELSDQHNRLGRLAADAYRSGISDPELRDLETILDSGDLDQAMSRMSLLSTAGKVQDKVVDTARTSEEEQRRSTAAADKLKDQAVRANEKAERAALVVTNTLAAQQTKTAELTRLLREAETKASEADRAAWKAEEQARQTASTSYASGDRNSSGDGLGGSGNRPTGPMGACKGGDTWSFSNGKIPISNLCPVWASPGHYLRADAAYGFDRMNEAYTVRFGKPVCITDSYRPYDIQVRLKLSKPGLAATPGKSNHGWGVATDLCGGINRFGTPQHEWMRANAGQFGWYLPGWAQQNGSKPEAWHWQYRW